MFKERTQNRFVIGESTEFEMNGEHEVASEKISMLSGGFKMMVGVQVLVAGGAGNAPLAYQVSFDGKEWSKSYVVSLAIGTDSKGVNVFMMDLTDVYVPFIRLVMGGAKGLGTKGRFKFLYAVSQDV